MKSKISNENKDIFVIFFKNQSKLKNNSLIDLKMLKITLKQWIKFYKPGFKKIYISGDFSNEEDAEEIINYLNAKFMKENSIKLLNYGKVPPKFNTSKTNIVNYGLIKTWEYLKEPFILGTNDIFPIKFVDDKYINKQYKIRTNDYEKMSFKERKHWLNSHWIKAIKYFKEKYNFDNKIICEGHNPYKITQEFMNFYLNDENLQLDIDRDIVHTLFLKMNEEEVMCKEEYCKATFISNKFSISKKDLKNIKFVNCTLPNHPKTKNLIKRIIKNI